VKVRHLLRSVATLQLQLLFSKLDFFIGALCKQTMLAYNGGCFLLEQLYGLIDALNHVRLLGNIQE